MIDLFELAIDKYKSFIRYNIIMFIKETFIFCIFTIFLNSVA